MSDELVDVMKRQIPYMEKKFKWSFISKQELEEISRCLEESDRTECDCCEPLFPLTFSLYCEIEEELKLRNHE